MDTTTFIIFFILHLLCFMTYTVIVKYAISKKAHSITINNQNTIIETEFQNIIRETKLESTITEPKPQNTIEQKPSTPVNPTKKPKDNSSTLSSTELYEKADEVLDALCEAREKTSH